ncbi:hypothetical protein U1Q18_022768 [Sarracenia purpurea var. burkii]
MCFRVGDRVKCNQKYEGESKNIGQRATVSATQYTFYIKGQGLLFEEGLVYEEQTNSLIMCPHGTREEGGHPLLAQEIDTEIISGIKVQYLKGITG